MFPILQVNLNFGLELNPVEVTANEALRVELFLPGKDLPVEAKPLVVRVHLLFFRRVSFCSNETQIRCDRRFCPLASGFARSWRVFTRAGQSR